MTTLIKTGRNGEAVAADYLLSIGYKILERNYRYKRSEIDLIVMMNDCVTFVEVKTRASSRFGFPEGFVSSHKRQMILAGAARYIEETNWEGNVRFDVVAVMMRKATVEEVSHFEDAFH